MDNSQNINIETEAKNSRNSNEVRILNESKGISLIDLKGSSLSNYNENPESNPKNSSQFSNLNFNSSIQKIDQTKGSGNIKEKVLEFEDSLENKKVNIAYLKDFQRNKNVLNVLDQNKAFEIFLNRLNKKSSLIM